MPRAFWNFYSLYAISWQCLSIVISIIINCLIVIFANCLINELKIKKKRKLSFLLPPSFLALQHLDISGNKLSSDLSRVISSFTELKSWNISGNQFVEPIPSLPLKSLKYLSLTKKKFTGEIPELLSSACDTLTGLDRNGNNLHGGSSFPRLLFCFGITRVVELQLLRRVTDGYITEDEMTQGTRPVFQWDSGELPESLTNLMWTSYHTRSGVSETN